MHQHHDWDEQHAHASHVHAGDDGSRAELAGLLAGLAEPPRRAVDLGCGTGATAVFLATQGIDVTGIDGSSVALERAAEHAAECGVTVTWVQADVLDPPLADGSMDLVLDRGCLHHVASADRPRYASQVARILRPGGVLLVRDVVRPAGHSHATTEASLREMIEHGPLHLRSFVTYSRTGAPDMLLAVIGRA